MIEVSAGVIYDSAGKILICQRGEGRNNAHLWEFPGGKREKGESAADCLVRELMEELALPVTDVQEIAAAVHGDIRFTFLRAKTEATPVRTEHEDVRFVTPREMLKFDFCPADVPMARRLAFAGVKHAAWDFDGTLLDSYPAMVEAFCTGAAELQVTVEPAYVLSLMKETLWRCCEVIGGEKGVEPQELLRAFRRHEKDGMHKGWPPMPGIPEALKAMQDAGVRHYVATHRDLYCRELLETAGLLPAFTGFVTSEDNLPRKPAPDMLLHLMEKHGLKAEECVMIGDRPLDTEAGMAAGMLSILIDPEDRFPDGKCDVRIRHAGELTDFIG